MEGETEEIFVKRVLNPFLANRGFFLIPSVIRTKSGGSRMRKTGGTVKLKKFLEEIRLLTRDSSASVITMMFDLQGLHNSFKENCGNDVACIEGRLEQLVDDTRFLPYLQLHEFEALLYSDVDVMRDHLGSVQRFRIPGVPPEEINMDNPLQNVSVMHTPGSQNLSMG